MTISAQSSVFLLDTGFVNGLAKLHRRAVHDRHFTLHLDEQIGDPVTVQTASKCSTVPTANPLERNEVA